jgi:glycosyltransferase involved in cell wall biosynthesis
MKILWFANTPCGASEKLCPNLVVGGWLSSLELKILQFKDIELHICFYWKENMSPFLYNGTMYYPILKFGGSSRISRTISRALGKNGNDKKDIASLLKIINMVHPDVIHIHGTEANFGMIQQHVSIPVIVSLQGILSVIHEKLFTGISFSKAWLNEGISSKIRFLSEGTLNKLMEKSAKREREILSYTKNIIGRTDWDRRICSVLAPRAQYFIGNEILRNTFYERKWNKESFNVPLHIVSTMSDGLYKGLETIVKTAKILCESKEIDFEWTVIGQSEKGNLAKIVRRWLRIDYNTLHIRLIGNKNEIELADNLCNSDIYCQVSHIENSSNSVCEAMLIGMPIIATFAGGTDSILENRKEGILIQDGDPYSLAGAIVEMAKNYNIAKNYAYEAFTKAQERHDENSIVNKILSIYNNIYSKNYI